MPALDRGFGGRLNYQPAPAKYRKRDATCVELVPLSEPTGLDAFVLGRDEIARFAFPLSSPFFPAFLEAKPDRVRLEVIFIDDTRQELACKEFKKEIQALHAFYGDRRYPLHPPMQILVETVASAKPNIDAAGTVNELPIPYQEGSPGPISQDERLGIVLQLFHCIWNHLAATQRLHYVVRPRETVKGKTFEQIKALTFEVRVDRLVSHLSIGEVVALFKLIADQIAKIKDAQGNQKDPNQQEHQSLITLNPSDDEIVQTLGNITIGDPELGPIRLRLGAPQAESA
jgi:hypothetical protein